MDSGEIRKKEMQYRRQWDKSGKCRVLRKHLKVLKRGDVKDVIRWCYAQWCDGSAMLEIVDVVASSCEVRGRSTASLESVNSSA